MIWAEIMDEDPHSKCIESLWGHLTFISCMVSSAIRPLLGNPILRELRGVGGRTLFTAARAWRHMSMGMIDCHEQIGILPATPSSARFVRLPIGCDRSVLPRLRPAI